MSSTSPTEVEVPVLASSKKQRSARVSGKKGWTPAAPELRRLVGCSYTTNDEFPPHMLVWAKRDGGPWWPARVAGVDEIPEDLKKQEEGWTCVKYYGVNSTQAFAWLKSDELSPYAKNCEEFCQQSIPNDFNVGDFKGAVVEIQDIAAGRNLNATSKASTGTTKHQESRILPASSSHNDGEDVTKDGAHAGDAIEQPMKRRKLKFKGVDSGPLTDDNLNSQSKGKESSKDLKVLDRTVEVKSKRKRLLKHHQIESDGDRAPTGDSLESPTKKLGSPTGNSSSLSSRELVKKARGKKTGADGVSL